MKPSLWDPNLTAGEVPAALEQGADPNELTGTGLSALHRFCNEPDAVQALLKCGADVNQQSFLSLRTPLHESVNPECVRLMIEYGANLELAGADKRSALHEAAGAGGNSVNLAKMSVLLEAGAQVDARDGQGRTPLHYARSIHAVDMLVEAGADILVQDRYGMMPVECPEHGMNDLGNSIRARLDWHADAKLAELLRQRLEQNTAPARYATDDWAPTPEQKTQDMDRLAQSLSQGGEEARPVRNRPMRL